MYATRVITCALAAFAMFLVLQANAQGVAPSQHGNAPTADTSNSDGYGHARSKNPYVLEEQRRAEQAISDGEFPELKGMTDNDTIQMTCRAYKGLDAGTCIQVAEIYAQQRRDETAAQRTRQEESGATLAALTRRNIESDAVRNAYDECMVRAIGRGANQDPASCVEYAERSVAMARPSSDDQATTTDYAQRPVEKTQPQAIAGNPTRGEDQHPTGDKPPTNGSVSSDLAGIFLFAILAASIALLIAGGMKKVVIFYDGADFGTAAVAAVALWLADAMFISSPFSTSFFNGVWHWLAAPALALLGAAAAVRTVSSAIKHNSHLSLPAAVAVGVFKMLFVALTIFVILAQLTKAKDPETSRKDTAIALITALLAGALAKSMINGPDVYARKGWAPPEPAKA